MEIQRKRDDTKPAPLRAIPVPVVARYAPDVVERCYQLWSTIAGTNCSATRRWYEAEVPEGTPIPTDQAIRGWVVKDGWHARRDADFRAHGGMRLFELQLRVFAVMEGHVEAMLLAQAGAFDANPAAGLVRLKPGELTGRMVERGIFPLMPSLPEGAKRAWGEMTLEEQEAFMREEIQGRKR